MQIYRVLINYLLLFLLVGCGGGQVDNPQILHLGKTEKALLSETEKNTLKFVQAVHYLEKLDIDLSFDYSTSTENRIVTNHINKHTGLGYIEFHYKDFKEYRTDNLVNGTAKIDITSIDKYNDIVKIKGKFDLTLTTDDNNISIYVVASDSGDNKNSSSMVIHEFRIYDKKNDEQIEVRNIQEHIDKNRDKITTGELYLGSEGYVKFESISNISTNYGSTYTLHGENNSFMEIKYKDKETISLILNSTHSKNLYYENYNVYIHQKPKLKYSPLKIVSEFDDYVVKYEYDNQDISDMSIKVDWYINDKKVEGVDTPFLNFKYLQKGDDIRAVLTLKNGNRYAQYVEKESIYSNKFFDNSPEPSRDFIEIDYKISTLEFEPHIYLDVLNHEYFDKFDKNNLKLYWKRYKNSDFAEIVEGSENSIIPTISLERYWDTSKPYHDSYFVFLRAFDGRLEKSIAIKIYIKPDIFKKVGYSYLNGSEENNRFIETNGLCIGDLNSDGLEDIVILVEDKTTRKYKNHISILYQQTDGNFSKPVNLGLVQTEVRSIAMADFNGDGLVDISSAYANNLTVVYQNNDGTLSSPKVFTIPNSVKIVSLEVCDFNGDGFSDLIVNKVDKYPTNNYVYNASLFFQKDGIFELPIKLVDSKAISNAGDINGDGKDDLIFKERKYLGDFNKYAFYYKVLSETSHGSFKTISTHFPVLANYISSTTFVMIDIDGDGFNDTLWHHNGMSENRFNICYSNGDGSFMQPSRLPTRGGLRRPNKITISDINGDGVKEIMANYSQSISVLIKVGTEYREFQALIKSDIYNEYKVPILVKDMNNDGKDDIVLGTSKGVLHIVFSKL